MPDGYLPTHFHRAYADLGYKRILSLIDSVRVIDIQLRYSRLPGLLENRDQDISYAKFFHKHVAPMSKKERADDMDLVAGLRIAVLEYRQAPQAWDSELEQAYYIFPPKFA